jgi:hypothetical protein
MVVEREITANEWLWKEKLQKMNGCGKRNDSKQWLWKEK